MKKTPIEYLLDYEKFLTDSLDNEEKIASAMLKYIREFGDVLLERELKMLDSLDCDEITKKVTRFEVIDQSGRAYSQWNCKIELSLQDEGKTMKVFLSKL